MSANLNNFDKLIALIYRDVDEAQPWFAFVDLLVSELGANDASVLVYSKHRQRFHYHITSDSHFQWTPQRVKAAIKASYMMAMDAPEPVTEIEFGSLTDYLNSELFKEFLEPFGVRHIIMVDAYNDEDQVVRIAASRTDQQGAFSNDERALLAALAPHLKNAVLLREKLHNTRYMLDSSLEVVATLNVGCVMFDANRRITSCNRTARDLFATDPRLMIKREQMILGGDDESTQLLDRAITEALRIHKADDENIFTATIAWATPHEQPLELIVKSVPNRRIIDSGTRTAVMLLFRNIAPVIDETVAVQLREKYGLSKSEAEIALLVAQGHTLEEAAALRGSSINTIKTHLRSMYEKLGVHRRAQLIALMSKTANALR